MPVGRLAVEIAPGKGVGLTAVAIHNSKYAAEILQTVAKFGKKSKESGF